MILCFGIFFFVKKKRRYLEKLNLAEQKQKISNELSSAVNSQSNGDGLPKWIFRSNHDTRTCWFALNVNRGTRSGNIIFCFVMKFIMFFVNFKK